MGSVNTAHFNFDEAKKELKLAEKDYVKFVSEHPECPFCGAPLGANHEEVHA